jgi:hypothetical protein
MNKKIYSGIMILAVTLWVVYPHFVRADDLSTSLVSCWDFETDSGATLVDTPGTNDLGIVGGGTGGIESGLISNAYRFNNPADKYATIVDNASLSPTGDSMWTTWVKMNEARTFQGYVEKYQGYLAGAVGTLQYFTVFDSVAGQSTASLTNDFGTGSWHFVVVWYTASDKKAHIQIDDGSVADAATGLSNGIIDNANNLYFGIEASHDYSRISQDSTRFYTRILSSGELTDLYNSGAGRDCSYTGGGGGAAVLFPREDLIDFDS